MRASCLFPCAALLALSMLHGAANADITPNCWSEVNPDGRDIGYGRVMLESIQLTDAQAKTSELALFTEKVFRDAVLQQQVNVGWMEVTVINCWKERLEMKDPPRAPVSKIDFHRDMASRLHLNRARVYIWGDWSETSGLDLNFAVLPILVKTRGVSGIVSVAPARGAPGSNMQARVQAAIRNTPVVLLASLATVASVLDHIEKAPVSNRAQLVYDAQRGFCWPDKLLELLSWIEVETARTARSLPPQTKAFVTAKVAEYRATSTTLAASSPACKANMLVRSN